MLFPQKLCALGDFYFALKDDSLISDYISHFVKEVLNTGEQRFFFYVLVSEVEDAAHTHPTISFCSLLT